MQKSQIRNIGKDIASLYGGTLLEVIQREGMYVFVIDEHGEIFETVPMSEKELLTF